MFLAVFFNILLFIFGCAGSSLLTAGFSLIVKRRGSSTVVVHGLLTAIASSVAGLYRVLGFGSVVPWL